MRIIGIRTGGKQSWFWSRIVRTETLGVGNFVVPEFKIRKAFAEFSGEGFGLATFDRFTCELQAWFHCLLFGTAFARRRDLYLWHHIRALSIWYRRGALRRRRDFLLVPLIKRQHFHWIHFFIISWKWRTSTYTNEMRLAFSPFACLQLQKW